MQGAPPDHLILGRAVLTNLTNPKVILFFAAFLPQFARGHGPISVQFLMLGPIFLVIGLAWDSVVGCRQAASADHATRRRRCRRHSCRDPSRRRTRVHLTLAGRRKHRGWGYMPP